MRLKMTAMFLTTVLPACGLYEAASEKIMHAGGISSTGNKTDDEEDESAKGGNEDRVPMSGHPPPSADSQNCDDKLRPSLLEGPYRQDPASAGPDAAICRGPDVILDPGCAVELRFLPDGNVDATFADLGQEGSLRAGRHTYAICGTTLYLEVATGNGTSSIHKFTLDDEALALTHQATGRAYIRTRTD